LTGEVPVHYRCRLVRRDRVATLGGERGEVFEMTGREFAELIRRRVAEFCKSLDGNLPAYCYVPLTTDEARIKVMRSRLFNEYRAGEIFGGWLKSTPELDVKKRLAHAAHEEYAHATLLEDALRSKGAAPHDYAPLPGQMALFNALEGLTDTVERIAAFPMATEGVAEYLIGKSLGADAVPDWVKRPYRTIREDEERHGDSAFDIVAAYATGAERRERAWRAVAMSLTLRRGYFDDLERWVNGGEAP
jgi:demethoxyubiquinone hydroxylase (CLK1/Coq7/Cat5 family)